MKEFGYVRTALFVPGNRPDRIDKRILPLPWLERSPEICNDQKDHYMSRWMQS